MDTSGYAFVVGGGKCDLPIDISPTQSKQANAWIFATIGSGIGKACALLFAKEGAAGVMVADLDDDASSKVAAECKAVATNAKFRVELIHVDITLEASVKHATSQTMQAFGRIDYCVNCAGVSSLRFTRTCTSGWLIVMFSDRSSTRCRHRRSCCGRLQTFPRRQCHGYVPDDARGFSRDAGSRAQGRFGRFPRSRHHPWCNRQSRLGVFTCCSTRRAAIHGIQTCRSGSE